MGAASRGLYAAFTCVVEWPNPNGIGGLAFFVRPWSARSVCVSLAIVSVSGSCPPAPPVKPLPNDPRVCAYRGDFARCAAGAATAAMQKAVTDAGIVDSAGKSLAANYQCKAGATTWNVWTCSLGMWPPVTVTFALAKTGWTTAATIAP